MKGDIIMHALLKDETLRKTWVQQVLKGRKDVPNNCYLKSEKYIPNNCFACLNHFFDGQPTKSNPSPSLFLTVSTNTALTPKPRKSPCENKEIIEIKRLYLIKQKMRKRNKVFLTKIFQLDKMD